jgi:hypothetical protein
MKSQPVETASSSEAHVQKWTYYFLIPKEKVEEIRERIVKTDRGEPGASVTSFLSILFMGPFGAAPLRGWGGELLITLTKDGEKDAYPPAGTSLQEFAHRHNYPCQSVPVGKNLQGSLDASTLFAGVCLQVLPHKTNYACKSVPAGKNLQVSAGAETRQQTHPHRDFLTGLISSVNKYL